MNDDIALSSLSICKKGNKSMLFVKQEDTIKITESHITTSNSCGTGSVTIPDRSILIGSRIIVKENTWRTGEPAYIRKIGYCTSPGVYSMLLESMMVDLGDNTLFDLNTSVGDEFFVYGDSREYNAVNVGNAYLALDLQTPAMSTGDQEKCIKVQVISFYFQIENRTNNNFFQTLHVSDFQLYPNRSSTKSSLTIEHDAKVITLGSGTSTTTQLKIDNGVYYGCAIQVLGNPEKPDKRISQVTLYTGFVYDFDTPLTRSTFTTSSNFHCINNLFGINPVIINHSEGCENVKIKLDLYYTNINLNVTDVIQSKLLSKCCSRLMVSNRMNSGVIFESISIPRINAVIRSPYKTKTRLLGISFKSDTTILDMIKIQKKVIAIGIWAKYGYYATNIESNSDGVFADSEFTTIEGDPGNVKFVVYLQYFL